MSFPRYPAYKPSDVEWLGEVPATWTVTPLKRIAKLVTSKAGERHNPIALENIESWTGRLVPTGTEFESDGIAFEKGDILFGKLRPYLAKAYLADSAGQAVGDFHVLRPSANLMIGKYLLYQILGAAFIDVINGSTFGSKMPRASWESLAAMPIVLPQPVEQERISMFLDRETAKIDALVAEQGRLIELLKEKRQAVISRAVTKGLNPDAPMKDSGVEWLGEVPAHWNVERLKNAVKSIEQGWSPQCESVPADLKDEWGVLKVGCVNGGCFDPNQNKLLPADLVPVKQLAVRSGDLLVSRANTREFVGGAAVVPRDFPHLLLCDKLYRIHLDRRVSTPAFLGFFLGTSCARGPLELSATGASSSMLNISQAAVLNLLVGFPPPAEQSAIIERIENETARIDSLINEAQRAIVLLQERRTALISAAVTGQIDVRPESMRNAA